VVGGPHIGEHGIVFKHPLDLRPHSVWLDTPNGQRLIPAHRLARCNVEGATKQQRPRKGLEAQQHDRTYMSPE
jgi:hypothetical protein